MQTLIDSKERSQALDINGSYIIQAPAGSGKTGLLVQRMLALLANARSYPEECLAITFTKKSAHEMQQRIVNALLNAENNISSDDQYEQLTIKLAKKVLKRDKELGWNIIQNPSRLKIHTIDALCAKIIAKFPVTIKYGVAPSILDDADKIYEEAVANFTMDVHSTEDYKTIAKVHNYNMKQMSKMFKSILTTREQWLPLIFQEDSESNCSAEIIVEAELANISNHIKSVEGLQLLPELAYYAAQNLNLEFADLFHFDDKFIWPDSNYDSLQAWKFIANLTITSSGNTRKTVNKNQGFIKPTLKDEQGTFAYKKQAMMQVLDFVKSDTKSSFYLNKLMYLPYMNEGIAQYNLKVAIKNLLPKLVAHLQLLFKSYGAIDFTEMLISAILALGDEDNPTDLNLELDAKLNHILVDEFQDTSRTQIRLLELLISGWEYNDGRTLFLVGDPMQSIYRFRQADVGMYLRIRAQGLGRIKLKPLTLTTNFRSYATLVKWVNASMGKCFSSYDDLGTSKVKFSSSVANKIDNEICNSSIQSTLFTGTKDESIAIAERILIYKETLPSASIAILVRSRTQLPHILLALQESNISYLGINIESLYKRPWIQDFIILFRAVNHWGDDIAWFSLLRSTFCGIELPDLTILAEHRIDESIWVIIQSEDIINNLSEYGQKRIKRLCLILTKCFSYQGDMEFGNWLYKLWVELGGLQTLKSEHQLEDIKLVFNLLQQSQDNNFIYDVEYLETKISNMFADKILATDENPINIMTIHKAKGLEFDIVFIPGLNYMGRSDEKSIMRWHQERVLELDESILHVNATVQVEDNEVLRYLEYIQSEKRSNENIRLLYVALTRAKSIIELMGSVVETKPKSGTFQNMLWSYLELNSFKYIRENIELVESPKSFQLTTLSNEKITLDLMNSKEIISQSDDSLDYASKQDTSWNQDVGTMVHQMLYTISMSQQKPMFFYDKLTTTSMWSYWKNCLLAKGHDANNASKGAEIVKSALLNTIQDERGAWILSDEHDWCASEWQLTMETKSSEVIQGIVDRIIIDDGTCWIIDYKTCKNEELTAELDKYKGQLSRYVSLAQNNIKAKRYVSVLYFPLQSRLVEVSEKQLSYA
ncbi:MAG: UvrD-helicase domain-containing protein [Francisellaceae bacterium]|mgnify:CR=1 FL=1|nr:UvrD-helicase domain-containing protein [Francisellaceae bacterium]MBT6539832.1 UvrD-helicase domain-containing protein [Francisellaceae bacterium]